MLGFPFPELPLSGVLSQEELRVVGPEKGKQTVLVCPLADGLLNGLPLSCNWDDFPDVEESILESGELRLEYLFLRVEALPVLPLELVIGVVVVFRIEALIQDGPGRIPIVGIWSIPEELESDFLQLGKLG